MSCLVIFFPLGRLGLSFFPGAKGSLPSVMVPTGGLLMTEAPSLVFLSLMAGGGRTLFIIMKQVHLELCRMCAN